jgi:hypothetical protein
LPFLKIVILAGVSIPLGLIIGDEEVLEVRIVNRLSAPLFYPPQCGIVKMRIEGIAGGANSLLRYSRILTSMRTFLLSKKG